MNVRPSPFECVCDAFLFVSGEAMRSALSSTIQRMTTLLPFAFGRSPSSSSRVMVAVEGGEGNRGRTGGYGGSEGVAVETADLRANLIICKYNY